MEEIEGVKKTEKKESWFELIRFTIIAILIVVPIRVFIAQPFVVSGSSMSPTFQTGDYLIVDELSYHLGDPERLEVAIFRYPNDTKKFFVKRVIGLPNETIEINDNKVTIYNALNPKGFTLNEEYVKNQSSNSIRFELKEGEYFMMGDNRLASSDSRFWGAVDRDLIVGRALIRLLPLNKVEVLPGDYKN